jgi:hypothetical protein
VATVVHFLMTTERHAPAVLLNSNLLAVSRSDILAQQKYEAHMVVHGVW